MLNESFVGERRLGAVEQDEDDDEEEKVEVLRYSLKHCITHLCQGGLVKMARDLMFHFEYLLERVKLGPVHMVVRDCNAIVQSASGNSSK